MPRRTKTSMNLALSAAITRSAAKAMWAPMPAAVPLTAAMTGFSQSMIEATRRWAPRLMLRPTSPSAFSGASSGPGFTGMRETRRSAPVQKCFSPAAVMTTARTLRSPLAASMSSMVRLRWSGVMALAASGRFSVSHATPSSPTSHSRSWFSVSLIVDSPVEGRSPRARHGQRFYQNGLSRPPAPSASRGGARRCGGCSGSTPPAGSARWSGRRAAAPRTSRSSPAGPGWRRGSGGCRGRR